MGFAHRAFVAAGVGFAVSAIVGCGSGGSLLSASQSNTLSEQLNRVTQALDAGDCSQAQQYLAGFQSRVDAMGGVNSTLISNLDQGASTIQSLANRECRPAATVPKRTHTHTETTATTTTTATQTTQTFTNPATQTYSTSTYTEPPTSTSTASTNTTGGSCATCIPTVTSTPAPPSTTTPSGGTGLGGQVDTSATTGDTTTTDTSGTVGSGY